MHVENVRRQRCPVQKNQWTKKIIYYRTPLTINCSSTLALLCTKVPIHTTCSVSSLCTYAMLIKSLMSRSCSLETKTSFQLLDCLYSNRTVKYSSTDLVPCWALPVWRCHYFFIAIIILKSVQRASLSSYILIKGKHMTRNKKGNWKLNNHHI